MNNVDLVKKMDMAGLSSLWRGLYSGKFLAPYDQDIMNSPVYADIINAVADEFIDRQKNDPMNIRSALQFEKMLSHISDDLVEKRVNHHFGLLKIPLSVSDRELEVYICIVFSPYKVSKDKLNSTISKIRENAPTTPRAT